MTQLSLEFQRPDEKGPVIHRFQLEATIANLRGRGWQTAADLGAKTESNRRVIRAIAEASEGEIISGQKGYKLTREATIDEVAEAGWLKSQGKKMVHRWIQIQRVYHRALQPQ